jgi:hypothetical protein
VPDATKVLVTEEEAAGWVFAPEACAEIELLDIIAACVPDPVANSVANPDLDCELVSDLDCELETAFEIEDEPLHVRDEEGLLEKEAELVLVLVLETVWVDEGVIELEIDLDLVMDWLLVPPLVEEGDAPVDRVGVGEEDLLPLTLPDLLLELLTEWLLVLEGLLVLVRLLLLVPLVLRVSELMFGRLIVTVSSVTDALPARARPFNTTLALIVMEVVARIVPSNTEKAPSVAELPTAQKTLRDWVPLMRTTWLAEAVMTVVSAWKIKTALKSPPPSRVTAPVIPIEPP